MRTKLLFLISVLALTSISALAGGGKSYDAYVGEHTLAEGYSAAKECPPTIAIEQWTSEKGVALQAGSLKGNFPKTAFSKNGHIACYAKNGDEKTCTQVKAEKDGPTIWFSEARYSVKGGKATALQKLAPVIALKKEDGNLEYKRFFQGKESYSCNYRTLTETEIQAKKSELPAPVVAKKSAPMKKVAVVKKAKKNRMPASMMAPVPVTIVPMQVN